jgi:hypothetical protein
LAGAYFDGAKRRKVVRLFAPLQRIVDHEIDTILSFQTFSGRKFLGSGARIHREFIVGFIGNSSSSSMVRFGGSGGERSTGGKQMDGDRSEIGDERNTPFELPEYTKEVTSGFDPGEEPSEVSEGHDRFSQRLKQEDIPQESLAERIRRDRQGS